MAGNDTEDLTTKQVNMNRNPNGKGGFGDNPENINLGGRPKNAESFAYWYMTFKNMTVSEMEAWQKSNPKDKRTVAADLSWRRVFNAQTDLKEFQEVADRSEGKPTQRVEHGGGENPIHAIIEKYGKRGKVDLSGTEEDESGSSSDTEGN